MMQLEEQLKLFSEITFELEKIDNKKFNEYLISERKNAATEEEQIQIVQACIEKTRDKISEIFIKVNMCDIFLESEKNNLKSRLKRLYKLMDDLSWSVEEGFNSPNYIVNLNNYREQWLDVYSCVNPEKNEYLEQINQAIANGESTIEQLSSIKDLHPNHMAIIDNVRQGKNEYPVLQNPYEGNETSNEYIPDLNDVGTKVNIEFARYEHGMYLDRSSLVDKIIEIYKEFNQDEISSKLDEIRDSIINLTGFAPEDVDYSSLKDQLSASKKLELLALMNQYKRWNEILDNHVNEDAFEKFRIELTETLRDYEDAIRLRDELAAQPTKFNFFDFKGKHDRKVIERTIKKRFKVKTVEELEAKLTDLKFNRGTILTEQQSSVKLTLRNQKKKIERSSKFEAGLEITSDAAQKFGEKFSEVATTVGTFASTTYQGIKDKIDESRKPKEIEYNGGDLDLSGLESAKGIKFPEVIDGFLNLSDLKKAKGLDLSNVTINGDLYLRGLTSAKDLDLSNVTINGNLYLHGLTSAKGLDLSNVTVNGGIYLNSLTSAEGLILPKVIGGSLNLDGLTSVNGLDLSNVTVNGGIYLNSLTSTEGLDLSNTALGWLNIYAKDIGQVYETLNCSLVMNRLTSAEGFILPKEINGYLSLDGLTSAEGLILPKKINDYLSLDGLTSAKGLILPEEIGYYLSLAGLTSAKDLDLSNVTVNDEIYLGGLTTTEGLENIPEHLRNQVILPDGMSFQDVNNIPTSEETNQEEVQVIEYNGGILDLNYLTSAKNVIIPKLIDNSLFLACLTSADGLDLSNTTIQGNLHLTGLTSAKGLDLSTTKIADSLVISAKDLGTVCENLNCSLNMHSLTSAESLILPKVINGDLKLTGLTSVNGLDLSNVTVNGNIELSGLTTTEGLENIPEHLRSKLIIPQSVVSLGTNGLNTRELLNDLGMLQGPEDTEMVVSSPASLQGDNPVVSEQSVVKPKKRILREEPYVQYPADSPEVSVQPTDTPVQVEIDTPTSEETNQEEVQVIEYNGGDLNLWNLESAKGIKFPEVIDGDLRLSGLTSAEGLILPKEINGFLSLDGLTSAKGLILPKKIHDGLSLGGLTSAEGLDLSNTALRWLNINAKDIGQVYETLNCSLIMNGLTSTEGLILPKEINGNLILIDLTSAKGLDLSNVTVNGGIYLNSLTSTEDLDLSNTAFGWLSIHAKDIGQVYETLNCSLFMNELTSAEGLILPKEIHGSLYLNGLTSAKGLDLSNTALEGLNINAKDIGQVYETLNCSLSMSLLTSAEGLILPKEINGFLSLDGLTSAKGLDLSNVTINGNLYLDGLTSAEGLDLSNVTVSGGIYLRGLTTTEGLENIPEHLRNQVSFPDGISFDDVVKKRI